MAESIDPKRIKFFVILGISIIVFIIFIKSTFVFLEPTERGIVWKKYTNNLEIDNVRPGGLNIIAPWNELIAFDVAEQQIEETMDVLSVDGLSISLDVSIRFRPKSLEIGYLFESFRLDYVANLVRPELRSAVRRIIGQYTPEELYATKRQEIETLIQETTHSILDANHVELRALLFRSIKLPETIKVSIEQKLMADQESQKREYMMQIAEKDAEIRITEARGKAEANKVLSASLTDKILQEKGIQATEELANSPNSKIIIIGSGKDGLPIILNAD
ncbi:MAG: prohibitin family protein [Bacteroidales bacterium]|nr:prohibitin family protein [Bacteroidales bacterium]MBN2821194.1 prohibitin family protein [Bacteroidales bacterium]